MEPAIVLTCDEIQQQFKFKTKYGVEEFLRSIKEHNITGIQVMTFMGESVLVIDEIWYDQFCQFMQESGYWPDETD